MANTDQNPTVRAIEALRKLVDAIRWYGVDTLDATMEPIKKAYWEADTALYRYDYDQPRPGVQRFTFARHENGAWFLTHVEGRRVKPQPVPEETAAAIEQQVKEQSDDPSGTD